MNINNLYKLAMLKENRIYHKAKFPIFTFCFAFIAFLGSDLSGYAQEGRYNFLNIGDAHNIEGTYEIVNGKLLINSTDRGFLEVSRDLTTWYSTKSHRRFTQNLNSEVEFFRLRKAHPRPARTYIPKTYDPHKKYPLVINLHGFTGDWTHQNGFLPLKKYSDQLGFIFIVPDGERDSGGFRRWNAIDACCGSRHDLLDDSAYLRQVIETARANFNVDEKRIYCMGFSNGGMMSYRMAIDHSDLLAGIVVVGGISYKEKKYAPEFPIHVLHIHGTNEENFHGTELGDLPFYHAPTPSVEVNMQNWAEFNNCNSNSIEENSLDLVERLKGNETTVFNFHNDSNGCDVELWQVERGVRVEQYSDRMVSHLVDWMLNHPKIQNR
jgi:polyhydroxybutyrate depolymerase